MLSTHVVNKNANQILVGIAGRMNLFLMVFRVVVFFNVVSLWSQKGYIFGITGKRSGVASKCGGMIVQMRWRAWAHICWRRTARYSTCSARCLGGPSCCSWHHLPVQVLAPI